MSLNREIWGPKFWSVLHRLAECSGISTSILSNDEADAWTTILKVQGLVMPCELCKQHYTEWKLHHRIPNLRLLSSLERKEFLRGWLWECHEAINKRNEKVGISKEDLETVYTKQNIHTDISSIQDMFSICLERSLLKREDIHRWKLSVTRLRMLYGI